MRIIIYLHRYYFKIFLMLILGFIATPINATYDVERKEVIWVNGRMRTVDHLNRYNIDRRAHFKKCNDFDMATADDNACRQRGSLQIN